MQKRNGNGGKKPQKQTQVNVRLQAIRALHEINNEGAFANIVLQQYINKCRFSDVDRRFFTELVYGVMRRRNYLDAVIKHFTKKPIRKLSSWVVEILRLGIYQIHFMDKIPVQAAVNESVKLAKKLVRGLAPFVNGVLRNYVRQEADISIELLAKTPAEEMALKYNIPEWMILEWLNMYESDEVEELCAYFNEKPKLSVRFNLSKYTKEEIEQKLDESNVEWEPSAYFAEGADILSHGGNLQNAEWVKDGYVTFMDEGSLAIAHVLDPKSGDNVLDVCAAPGGKTLHIASLMNNEGYIKACDIYEARLELIKDNAKRLGISIVDVMQQDGQEEIPNTDQEKYNRVLVDAPCSGLGILQKKLDMRWTKDKSILTSLCDLQYSILDNASKAVAKDGVLVYSTCTLNRRENEDIVERFLKNNPEFTLEDASELVPFDVEGPMITLAPHHFKTDGFFMARMRKI